MKYKNNTKEKVIIFGTGKSALKMVDEWEEDLAEIIAYVDNDKKKQGDTLFNIKIISPEDIEKYTYDKVIICSVFYEDIYKQLTEILRVKRENIDNKYYFCKKKLLLHYESKKNKSVEEEEVLHNIRMNFLKVFNYPFSLKYKDLPITPVYDKECSLYYVIYYGKRMYMHKKYSTPESVIYYCRNIFMEQDPESPHCYIYPSELTNSIVIDGGTAEGNFALSIIDKVERIYLVEEDIEWIKALQYTFKPYEDKVVYVNRFLNDNCSEKNITIDEIVCNERKIDYIKLDIEGFEYNALKGAEQTLCNNRLFLNVCSYHNLDDEEKITSLLLEKNYNVEPTSGYMVYILEQNYRNSLSAQRLVRGIMKANSK